MPGSLIIMELITCDSVCKTYRQGFLQRKQQQALYNLNLNIKKGEIVGIIGPNGAGKSSLIKIILGFVKPDSGSIYINDSPAGTPASRINLSYLPETNSLYKQLSITDHLTFLARLSNLNPKKRNERITDVLHLVGLSNSAKKPLRSYSKGMTQRAALAYALFTNPEILILDEPMSGLDPVGRNMVIEILRKSHQNGTTILFCSHILNDVERICDRIGIMDNGQLQLLTTPEELKNNYANRPKHLTPLEACFLQTIESQNET